MRGQWRSGTLLQRLERPGSAADREISASPEEMIASIRTHLETMLNSRHHGSLTVPDYGTSDLSDLFRGHESVELIQREISRSIERYEPRLTDVEVAFVEREDSLGLHFDIVATIVTDDEESPAVFRTVVESPTSLKVSAG